MVFTCKVSGPAFHKSTELSGNTLYICPKRPSSLCAAPCWHALAYILLQGLFCSSFAQSAHKRMVRQVVIVTNMAEITGNVLLFPRSQCLFTVQSNPVRPLWSVRRLFPWRILYSFSFFSFLFRSFLLGSKPILYCDTGRLMPDCKHRLTHTHTHTYTHTDIPPPFSSFLPKSLHPSHSSLHSAYSYPRFY